MMMPQHITNSCSLCVQRRLNFALTATSFPFPFSGDGTRRGSSTISPDRDSAVAGTAIRARERSWNMPLSANRLLSSASRWAGVAQVWYPGVTDRVHSSTQHSSSFDVCSLQNRWYCLSSGILQSATEQQRCPTVTPSVTPAVSRSQLNSM